MIPSLFATFNRIEFAQYLVDGISFGLLIALIALGYTMVYGIVELINFAHGDLFMLGAFLAWTLLGLVASSGASAMEAAVFGCFIVVPLFAAILNVAVDRVVYKPLRNAPKLAPLVSAIGVSFVFVNIGLFWGGPQSVNFPEVVPAENIFEHPLLRPLAVQLFGEQAVDDKKILRITYKDLLVVGVTIPLMVALSVFVRYARLGKAMRATAQNPVAARLMGIDTDRVIGSTFAIGGALAGAGSVVYALKLNSIHFQMGYQNGLYAFTAAVLGGIGNIPGAVLGALLIGLVRSLGSAYFGEKWTGALVFATLMVVLVFRPSGLLGARIRDKV